MGGKSKKQTIGYKFYAGANLVMARYISKLLQIKIGDKLAVQGSFTGGDIPINAPLLFGTKAEGGVTGTFRFRKGDSLQDVDPYLASLLGSDISADIGVSSLTLVNPWLGNTPYLKDVSVRGERVFELEGCVEQWYVEKAGIVNYDQGGAALTVNWELIGQTTADGISWTVDGLTKTGTFNPGDGQQHTVILRMNSIQELENYVGGTTVSSHVRIGGTPSNPLANIYSMHISSPDKTYYLNQGIRIPTDPLETVTDELFSVQIDDGATVTLTADPQDGYMRGNYQSMLLELVGGIGVFDINPVHIIREALLNTEWGYGYSELDIDDANFRAVADTLYGEAFGLSYFWDDDTALDAVVNKVLDHIDGVLYLDRDTLKFKLALNRADYDADTLIELRDTIEVSRIDNYKKPQFLDLVNTVTVNYYNTANGGSGSVSQSNSALFLQQGMRKSVEVDYQMCRRVDLAGQLLQRELDKQTNPYSTCDVYSNSAAKSLRRGSVFKLTSPDYNYYQTIMRVTDISYGDGKSKAIKISCVEDRFAMPTASAVEAQDPDVPVVGNPTALSKRLLIEEPYAFLIERLGQSTVEDALTQSPESGYYGMAAKREANALTCDIYGDDGAGYENVARLDFCPYGELQASIDHLDSSFTLENLSDIDSLDGEILFQIDDEIMALGSINASTGAVTGALRGCFDTVPAPHDIGAKVFFIGAWLDGAQKEYVEGETINVKLVPTNSAGTLPLGSAPADSLTFAGRALRPYAPGLFKIGGTAYPATASGAFAVTWAHRDRKAQADQVVDTLQPSVALPDNQRYGLAFYDDATNTLLIQRTDIGAATASATLNFTGNVRCELWTIDNNDISWQRHSFVFAYTPPVGTPVNQITATAYTPVDDSTIIDGGGD